MYRLTVLYPPTDDPGHFRQHYVSVHLPLAAQLPGLQAMSYSLDLFTLDGADSFAAIWHGDFDSNEAMTAALTSSQGRATVADLPNFAPVGAQIIHYAPGPSSLRGVRS
jgi:uncharacterized protein (TIGR02118 family)